MAQTADIKGGVPRGIICGWYGNIANIPTGWILCDGAGGTPDYRNKFIVGAQQDVVGVPNTNVKGVLQAAGGVHEHTLVAGEMPVHNHSHTHLVYFAPSPSGVNGIPTPSPYNGQMNPTYNVTSGNDATNAGSGNAHENCPPFVAFVFIMKT